MSSKHNRTDSRVNSENETAWTSPSQVQTKPNPESLRRENEHKVVSLIQQTICNWDLWIIFLVYQPLYRVGITPRSKWPTSFCYYFNICVTFQNAIKHVKDWKEECLHHRGKDSFCILGAKHSLIFKLHFVYTTVIFFFDILIYQVKRVIFFENF